MTVIWSAWRLHLICLLEPPWSYWVFPIKSPTQRGCWAKVKPGPAVTTNTPRTQYSTTCQVQIRETRAGDSLCWRVGPGRGEMQMQTGARARQQTGSGLADAGPEHTGLPRLQGEGRWAKSKSWICRANGSEPQDPRDSVWDMPKGNTVTSMRLGGRSGLGWHI